LEEQILETYASSSHRRLIFNDALNMNTNSIKNRIKITFDF
jgi:hypothetical protein